MAKNTLLRLLRPGNPFRAKAAPQKPADERGEDGAEEAADLLLRLGS